ncbi:hypothetical protein KCP74_21240 [Salmonella enterica subsp. enterica]|nr:hypothetical protein KCP74_21240 [Salmonella enterica subsp. enterica]
MSKYVRDSRKQAMWLIMPVMDETDYNLALSGTLLFIDYSDIMLPGLCWMAGFTRVTHCASPVPCYLPDGARLGWRTSVLRRALRLPCCLFLRRTAGLGELNSDSMSRSYPTGRSMVWTCGCHKAIGVTKWQTDFPDPQRILLFLVTGVPAGEIVPRTGDRQMKFGN